MLKKLKYHTMVSGDECSSLGEGEFLFSDQQLICKRFGDDERR